MEFRVPWLASAAGRGEPYTTNEWLVTNGLGGFASGTLVNCPTRRYHGLLIASLSQPPGRFMMLNHLDETLHLPDGSRLAVSDARSSGEGERSGQDDRRGVTEFTTHLELPAWVYEIGDVVVERQIVMPHGQNTTLIRYHVREAKAPIRLTLRPQVHFRPFSKPVGDQEDPGPYEMKQVGTGYELRGKQDRPPLFLRLAGPKTHYTPDATEEELTYLLERSRGYPDRGKVWCPGYFTAELSAGESATLIASVEDAAALEQVEPEEVFRIERQRREQLLATAGCPAGVGRSAQLVLAADQFLIKPVFHPRVEKRLETRQEEPRSIIAGYHWFGDWGRDAMISLEGLTLVTRRFQEGRSILLTFASQIEDGLIPTRFGSGSKGPLYYAADVSFWFFHALDRYVQATSDHALVRQLLPQLRDIIEHYVRGTKHNIGVDPADGLVRESSQEYPLTWMDAMVGDWIVTPRRGKPVEINALWYNSLRLLEDWLRQEGDAKGAGEIGGRADRVRQSFNDRYWNEAAGYLHDVIDGPDGDNSLCRPNQIFALSLRYPVLDEKRWQPVFAVVTDRLLTPVGLRSLAPGSPDYQSSYFGDRRARDGAYHQGTVWPWLLGAYIDAWLRVHPDQRLVAHAFLEAIVHSMGEGCIGSLNEIYDAEPPFTPRGCIAQAWSVAEVLRSLVQTAPEGHGNQ
jgi:predicted glycogen debranching enzyme